MMWQWLSVALTDSPKPDGGALWQNRKTNNKRTAFEVTSKRRKGYPSETNVKRGVQIVHGDKTLEEKLGRNDPCPCKSGRKFQELLSQAKAV